MEGDSTFLPWWFHVASVGIQRFEMGGDNELGFTCTELKGPMRLLSHGEHQQEAGYRDFQLKTDELLI